MKKILIVLYYYHPYVSGLSILAKNLAENLVKRGYKVTVLTTKYNNKLSNKENIEGVEVKRVPVLFSLGKGVFAPTLWIQTIKLSLTHDVVNFHLPMADTALAALFIAKRKLVTQYHCDLNLGTGLISRFILLISFMLMNIILKRSKHIVVLTKDYFEHCKFKKYIHKAVAIYPPIDHKRWSIVNFNNINIHSSFFKIGFVGRIVEEKGLQYLFESIPHIIKHDPKWKFKIIIAGELNKVAGGSIYNKLIPYTQKYPEHISFIGYLSNDDLLKFYNEIDLLVLPSVDPLEAFGMVQLEAMLCGTPVVASNMPGVREVVRKTSFGALATPKDALDLANKIIYSRDNMSKFKQNYSREDLLSLFDFEKELDKYEKLFS
ncbi:MAG: glycosyltransferase family 4 protein [Oligoflexia bacterium]|nr:glycosyltransferase family 4 protein [Oligoflexia bacterium]